MATYFDPMPIWYEPFEHDQTSRETFPLNAVTQRPMFMYHAWGSQNAWLRQIAARNWLYLHPDTAAAHDLRDGDWAHLESHHGRITVPVRIAANVQPDTVWSWNAIGKRRGAWRLSKDAPESKRGGLLTQAAILSLTSDGTRHRLVINAGAQDRDERRVISALLELGHGFPIPWSRATR